MLLRLHPAGAATSGGKRTLERLHDPVVVSTARLGHLADRRIDSYRLYRVAGGTAEAIPFQFDALDDDGQLVLPAPPSAAPPTFDENDAFVFMAKDTGDRAAWATLPAQADLVLEIEVAERAGGKRGWVYLLHFPGPAPARSPVVYARFDAGANEARALFYQIHYAPGRSYFTGMEITRAAGGRGENVIERMRVLVNPTFSFLFTNWSPVFTEESFTVELEGVKNGPVRAVRRLRQTLDLGAFFPEVPSGTSDTYYYFSSFVTPSKFSLPWLALKALADLHFEGVSDFGDETAGLEYWDGANPDGIAFGGPRATGVNTTEDHDWYVVSGPKGTVLSAFVIPERWRAWGIKRGTVFLDHPPLVDPTAGRENPAVHQAGYSLLNMPDLEEPGSYDLNSAIIVLPRPYQRGDEREALEMLREPLEAEVRPLEVEGSRRAGPGSPPLAADEQ